MTLHDGSPVGRPGGRPGIAIAAYASLFVVALPLLLGLWMHRLDTLLGLAIVGSVAAGVALTGVGVAVMAVATLALWTLGRGLPMSPFPPERIVTDGIYRVVADPLYLGAVLACVGYACIVRSAAGLWIVSPVLALAATAFVMGFERDATRQRFGRLATPLVGLPLPGDDRPGPWDRISVYVLVFLPWLILYEAVSRLGPQPGAWSTYMGWEQGVPVVPWTESIYAMTYPYALAVPILASRRQDLRRFAVQGLAATALISIFYLLVPLVAAAKPVPDGTIWSMLMQLERYSDQRATALPAFHVVWACLASALYAATWPRMRWPAAIVSVAIGVSCVTSGMHSIADVVAGFAAYALIVRSREIWNWLCRAAEVIANSWGEWQIGPIRLLSHGIYAGVGGAVGVMVAVWLAGPAELWWIVGLALGAEFGAGLWAQLIEGSPQLLRPYGYFGSVVAVMTLAALAGLAGRDTWLLLAAMAAGGSFTQALGRLRCLVQGCCHGKAVEASWGIRYSHPRSRVVRLSGLGGTPLHPTQLYSFLWSVLTGVALLRLWALAAPLPFIFGSYLILIGLGRFVEEHYRGEPQTAWVAGLRLYQWLAIAQVVVGAVVTAVGGALAPGAAAFDPAWLPVLALVAVLTYAAYGVDFPRSDRRLSRLV
jgi:protein-S-isoprenylcysteine O-methyltransferase Ste14